MSSTAIFNPMLGPVTMERPRRLGSVMPVPRNLYMLYLPLVMSFTALACWVIETDTMLMIGSVVLGLISLYTFYQMVVEQKPIRVSTLLMTTLGLGYGLGTANTWFTLPRSGQDLGVFLHRDPAALTHTMGSVLFSMGILLAVGEVAERPIFGEDFVLRFPPQSFVFITAGVGVIVAAYATGKLNFMGASTGEGNTLGIFSAFSVWLVGTLFAFTLVAALNVKGTFLKLYLILLTLVQFLLEIPMGRRSLLFTIVVAGMALRLGRFRFNWSWPKRIVIGILLAAMLYVTSIAFFYLRLAGFASGKAHLGIVERVTLAVGYFEDKNFDEVQKSFSKNVQTRTFILGFLAELEDFSTHFTPGYGRDLIGQFEYAIPSVLYPDKNRYFGEEGLANELFGSAYIDEANSILTGGAVDFGLLGMVIYPLVISLILRSFFEFIGQALPTFVATFIIFAGFSALLQPETQITDYFLIMRNGLLFGSVVWFFIALPAFRLSNREGR